MKVLSLRSLFLFVLAAMLHAQQPPFADPIARFIDHEIADKQIPALSIAVVQDGRIVWSRAFGSAKPDTVWRVGSISKLFTDIAVMQLVERGKIDIDAPLATYLPDFKQSITLRQIMAHRAGLLREPPIGHYFDPSEPGMEATAKSMAPTSVVYTPGTHTKY